MARTPRTPAMPDRVVVGYDGSAPAERALARAVVEAERRGTGLEILMGAPWTPPPSPGVGLTPYDHRVLHRETREQLDQAAEQARKTAPGLTVVTTLSDEPAARALVDASRSAALTVVGTRGHGGFTGLLLGSVSLRVATRVASPLMVVRADTEGDAPIRDTVVVGVQTDRDRPAVRFAFDEARRREARLRVLHAWVYPAPLGGMPTVDAERTHEQVEERRKLAESIPRYAAAPLRDEYPTVVVDTDHVPGSAAAVLVRASGSADVVVVAAHRHPHRIGMRLGPVANALLHHAHCPVVLVPVG